ncbi:GTP-binding protein Di-Ras2 isoform X1 [Hydra vulgaris]|uniref:GTP-binding protein Di-Ras2 isoform X1 n=1 Tax=Hydra vulgaris TaxID=6087 RepID=UPI001F5F988E|nr:GTP-binding protein Di-Ras2 [Hydra vulgaris]
MKLHLGKSRKCLDNDQNVPSYKIALFGDEKVGKSSILRRLQKKSFSYEYEPTISEVYDISFKSSDGLARIITFFDTSGSIECPPMARLTMTKCEANIVVYSVTSKKSLEVANRKLNEISKTKGPGSVCLLVGNKCDVAANAREVSFECGLKYAVNNKCAYLEVSALKNINILNAIDIVVKKLVDLNRTKKKVLSRSKSDYNKTNDKGLFTYRRRSVSLTQLNITKQSEDFQL